MFVVPPTWRDEYEAQKEFLRDGEIPEHWSEHWSLKAHGGRALKCHQTKWMAAIEDLDKKSRKQCCLGVGTPFREDTYKYSKNKICSVKKPQNHEPRLNCSAYFDEPYHEKCSEYKDEWCSLNFDATEDRGDGTKGEEKYKAKKSLYNKLCDGNPACVDDRLKKYMENVRKCRDKCKGPGWETNEDCLGIASKACPEGTMACKRQHMEGVIMNYCGVEQKGNKVLPNAAGKNDPACSTCMRQEPTTQAERIAAGVEKIPGQEENALVEASRSGSKIQPPSCWLQACEDGYGKLASDKFHPDMSAIKCLGLFNCSINVEGGVQGSVRLINDCATVPPPPPGNALPNRVSSTRISLPSSEASAQNKTDDKSKDEEGKGRKKKVLICVVFLLVCVCGVFLLRSRPAGASSRPRGRQGA